MTKTRVAQVRTAVVLTAMLFGYTAAPNAVAVTAPPGPVTLHIATFDSGFGGYLTAKSIERATTPLLRDYKARFTIRHYGDTRNLPYGEKTPQQIATLASGGVLKAFQEGADIVFIACNTASTQYARVREAVDAAYPGAHRPVISIIDVSVAEAKLRLDTLLKNSKNATLLILATPATVRSMVYPRGLAALYGVRLDEQPLRATPQPRWYRTLGSSVDSLVQRNSIGLPGGSRIAVYQFAPANWVELIEHGADLKVRHDVVNRDLGLLLSSLEPGDFPDVVGYFCTHYPILDNLIRARLAPHQPSYIAQGELMARVFASMAEARLQGHERDTAPGVAELANLQALARASITISGRNGETTRALARMLYPDDPEPQIMQEDLGDLGAVPAPVAQ